MESKGFLGSDARKRECRIGATKKTITHGCQPTNEYVEPPPPTVTVANPTKEMVVATAEFTGQRPQADDQTLLAVAFD